MSNTRSNTSGVTTFKSQPVITSTILANTDSSTNIATTAWSNAFWTYVKTLSNTWSGTQTFSDVNATYFTLRSTTYGNSTNSCLLDTNQKTTLVTQFAIGVAYTEEVYIGNGAQLKKIVIGNTATTAASEIKIGNSNSTTTILGTTNIGTTTTGSITIGQSGNTTSINSNITYISGGQFPLRVYGPSNYGVRIEPNAAQGAKGNINIFGCFPSLPTDIAQRRVCDIYGGFSGNGWGNEYMSLGVGYDGVTNDLASPTIEQIRISRFTTTIKSIITNIGSDGLPAAGRVNIANGTNTAGSEVYLGSTTLTKCFIRANDVNINHTVGGSIYMGTDTAGSTNILGSVNIGRYLGGSGNINIGGDSTTTGYVVTGGANVALNYVRGKEVFINDGGANYPNNGNVTIGNTLGSGNITINKPLTIGYIPSALTSFNQIGYSLSSTNSNGVSPTARLYSPINGLVTGVYLTNLYLYNSGSPVGSTYLINLADYSIPIINGQETITGVFYDGGQEAQSTKNTQNVGWCMKAGGVININPENDKNIAIKAVTSSDATSNFACVITLKVTRIA